MEPVSLLLAALAAGAAKGVGDTAATAVKDAYEQLKAAVAARFRGRPALELVLAKHAKEPDTFEAPLTKELVAVGADTDPRIVHLAQELMALIDQNGSAEGKYRVDLPGAKGVQIGDNNSQTNTFS